jgi:hypothetical protein
MTPEQITKLKALSKSITDFEKELQSGEISNLYAATHEAAGGDFVIKANSEGLIYFATILLSLAADANENQHFHYDKTSVLSECEKPIIFQFNKAPWPSPK